jgi:hypothetical protein
MKKVILTNSTVIPFFKKNPNDPDEILRIVEPKEGSDFTSTIINFNIETKSVDSAESKSKIFEKCTIYANGPDKVKIVQNIVKAGAILELEGYEKRTKSEKDNKYYNSVIIKNITPISAGIDNNIPINKEPTEILDNEDDDLPF